jgi:hypothetical protein
MMGWQELIGKRVCVGNEHAEVIHVDAFRIVLQTVPGAGETARRLVVSPDEQLDFELPEEQGQKE